jgi:hypothetical protein
VTFSLIHPTFKTTRRPDFLQQIIIVSEKQSEADNCWQVTTKAGLPSLTSPPSHVFLGSRGTPPTTPYSTFEASQLPSPHYRSLIRVAQFISQTLLLTSHKRLRQQFLRFRTRVQSRLDSLSPIATAHSQVTTAITHVKPQVCLRDSLQNVSIFPWPTHPSKSFVDGSTDCEAYPRASA